MRKIVFYLLQEGLGYVVPQPKHHDAAIVQQVSCIVPHDLHGQRYALRRRHSAAKQVLCALVIRTASIAYQRFSYAN